MNPGPLHWKADSYQLYHQGSYLHFFLMAVQYSVIWMLLLLLLSRFVVSDSVWPIDGSLPGSRIPGILKARTLEWVAISFSSAWKVKRESEVAQSCPTLRNPMDHSLPGSSVHGIFQARVLEWGANAFSIYGCTSLYNSLLLGTWIFPIFCFYR